MEHQSPDLDALLKKVLGPPPQPDFAAWREQNLDAVVELQQSQQQPRKTLVTRRRWLIKTASVAVGIGGVAVAVSLANYGGDRRAVAAVIETLKRAETIAWTTTFHHRVTSRDGKRRWIERESRESAYRWPGLYREVFRSASGEILQIRITDALRSKTTTLFPATKEAVVASTSSPHNPNGPFAWVPTAMVQHDLELVETVRTPRGEASLLRAAFYDRANQEEWSYDFLIAKDSKRLVEINLPGKDIYDPETDPDRDAAAEAAWSTLTSAGTLIHDIVFDAEFDASAFSLQSPAGYTVRSEAGPSNVQEEDVAEFLRVLAEINGQVFPDRVTPTAISSAQLRELELKADRSPAENRLLDIMARVKQGAGNRLPLAAFVQSATTPDTFRYIGKGVELGDASRLVCWYMLERTGRYRAIYGDLSIRDVASDDLPLPAKF